MSNEMKKNVVETKGVAMSAQQVLEAIKAANVRETGGKELKATRIYKVALTGDASAKLAPQAIKLLEILFSLKNLTANEVELFEIIESHKEISKKQSPWLIFQYYRKVLVEAGFLSYNK